MTDSATDSTTVSAAQWHEGDITANDINLHYVRTGNGEQPPLVLAHGITDSGRCWTRLARALGNEYDLVMVDARGHGDSDKPTGEYSSRVHAADLAGLIEALALSQPRVIGHSMGAATVSTLAATRPDLVSRVVLEDPPWRSDAPGTVTTAQRSRALDEWRSEMAERQKLPQAEIAARGRKLNPKWNEMEFEPWSRAKKQVSLDVFSYRLDEPNAWRDIASRIQCPALLVTGDPALGAIVTPETAAGVAAANEQIEVVQIANAGHNIRREQFDEFLRVVRDFLA